MIDAKNVCEFPTRQLSELGAQELRQMVVDATAALKKAKRCKEHLDDAVRYKYRNLSLTMRQQQQKDTGVIHFQDGETPVTSDLPKKPTWDQKKLSEIARKIDANGEDPAEYLDITYKISETKYKAWPESLRESFAPARTMNTGKETFTIGEVDL